MKQWFVFSFLAEPGSYLDPMCHNLDWFLIKLFSDVCSFMSCSQNKLFYIFLFAKAQWALGTLSNLCILFSSCVVSLSVPTCYTVPPCFCKDYENSTDILARFQNYFWLSTVFTVLLLSRNLQLPVFLHGKGCCVKNDEIIAIWRH